MTHPDENRNKFFSEKAVFFFFSIEKNFVSFEKQDNCRFGGKSLDKFQNSSMIIMSIGKGTAVPLNFLCCDEL